MAIHFGKVNQRLLSRVTQPMTTLSFGDQNNSQHLCLVSIGAL